MFKQYLKELPLLHREPDNAVEIECKGIFDFNLSAWENQRLDFYMYVIKTVFKKDMPYKI